MSPFDPGCVKRARAKNAQNCFLYRLLLVVVASTFGFQIYEIEKEFLHVDRTLEFSRGQDTNRTSAVTKVHAFKAAFLPIQALTQTVTMPSPEFGDGYAASRFHHDYRRRGSGVAAQGPRAAAGADGKDRSDVGIQCERSRSKAVRRSA